MESKTELQRRYADLTDAKKQLADYQPRLKNNKTEH
jgi:hypothetical protein